MAKTEKRIPKAPPTETRDPVIGGTWADGKQVEVTKPPPAGGVKE